MNAIEQAGIGTTYHTKIKRHESIMRALETGDPEFVRLVRNQLFATGMARQGDGYVVIDESEDHNLVPTTGLNHWLAVCFDSSTAKRGFWYVGLFTSNSTPALGWDGDWGAVSGGDATEMTAAQMDGLSARPAVTFGSAPGGGVLSSSASTSITLASGVADLTVYGATLNSLSTIAYNSGASILISAVRFNTPKSGLDAGDKIDLDFEITLANPT